MDQGSIIRVLLYLQFYLLFHEYYCIYHVEYRKGGVGWVGWMSLGAVMESGIKLETTIMLLGYSILM